MNDSIPETGDDQQRLNNVKEKIRREYFLLVLKII